jgi:hypothetical protein
MALKEEKFLRIIELVRSDVKRWNELDKKQVNFYYLNLVIQINYFFSFNLWVQILIITFVPFMITDPIDNMN